MHGRVAGLLSDKPRKPQPLLCCRPPLVHRTVDSGDASVLVSLVLDIPANWRPSDIMTLAVTPEYRPPHCRLLSR
jgi:hypothetical protein